MTIGATQVVLTYVPTGLPLTSLDSNEHLPQNFRHNKPPVPSDHCQPPLGALPRHAGAPPCLYDDEHQETLWQKEKLYYSVRSPP